jgi:hypothetical protein
MAEYIGSSAWAKASPRVDPSTGRMTAASLFTSLGSGQGLTTLVP